MGVLRFTILGCGSSGGVPRLGGHWGECDPDNPRNRRRRCSLLVERDGPDGTTTVLIDTSPDMRSQLLDSGTGRLDGVVYTHSHADHVHGIDDLRMIVFNMRDRIPVYADGDTQNALLSRFGYAFVQPEGSPYPPILDLRGIDGPLTISGPGGDITLRPFEVNHGSIDALGFRIGDVAYLPDVAKIPDSALAELQDLDCWILDALRRKPHPTHLSLDEALEWIERMAPKRAVLTNMHIDLDYSQVAAETPEHIDPAYDGMVIEYPI
ncbi:MBL fold metallo-hydrolase [Phaeobacter gallaeciensis]|uniref:Metallo beta-lactamase domain-containing protein n=1 Tax=Phaeobacter gallaeciensis TaxID=60890 RepID=A0AAC9ZC36_9RHOB|nr:MBL fold metallo-hydrolase [Phaeobacter gallaeciensis]AHD10427.1 Metal-dependent hydrolase of the beta-lactamase superfamily I [Phaeobacter gallaeciensis DSM 26640]ATE93690.1 metallo beta-lactamase domain-containing protein [Phaeobacter gallaeciensis]ATE96489.1 metallo beta-lactamase domain-containing protein [Phaeobacter gallaeciensis]ATF02354.1 metallo beta-lactamase domain-containing protein [Phaeobacter gallaeciensis]ATF06734.1 metallo beta-lactamase domain-containing protein [Phaeobact